MSDSNDQNSNIDDDFQETNVDLDGGVTEIIEETNEEEDDIESTAVFQDHQEQVLSVAFSSSLLPDGSIVFGTGSKDDHAIIYHVSGDAEPRKIVLEGHHESVNCVKFSPDGQIFATGDLGGIVITWNSLTGEKIAQMETSKDPNYIPSEKGDEEENEEEESSPQEGVEWISWHPTLPAILVGDAAGLIWLFNAKTAKCAKVYSCHAGSVTCGGFRPDGSKLWSGSDDEIVKIWAAKSGEAIQTVHFIHATHAPIISGDCSPNGALIVVGDSEGRTKIVRIDDGKVLGVLECGKESIEDVKFSPDSLWVAAAGMNSCVTIWNTNTFIMRLALQHPSGVSCIKWHPTLPYLITGCLDGKIRIFDSRNGENVCQFHGHHGMVISLDVRSTSGSSSDLFVLSGSEDTTVHLNCFICKKDDE